MKDNCSYRFDAILAVALEQDARQELALKGFCSSYKIRYVHS